MKIFEFVTNYFFLDHSIHGKQIKETLMPVKYTDFKQAKDQAGLRMVVVGGLPSPWSEAAKAILHIKKLPWTAIYHNPYDPDMANWTGSQSAPVLIYDNDAPRTDLVDILSFAENLSPEPALLPADPINKKLAIDLCHDICGEMGLGWMRRLDSVHKGLLEEEGGFPVMIAQYLASKYGYHKHQAQEYSLRIIELLNSLSNRLRIQRDAGEAYYIGSCLTAVDIYSATFMALFKPLPHIQCQMNENIRPVFESLDDNISKALDPILIEHRDFIYSQHLELPLSL